MITLTRLNSQPLIVNSDLIKYVENAPDTVITLVTGEKLVVREGADVVVNRIVEFRRRITMLDTAPTTQLGSPLAAVEVAVHSDER